MTPLRALMDSCAAGVGVTVLPHYLCASSIDEGRLVAIHSPAALPGNDIFLAWNRTGLRQPRTALVRDRILEAARSW